jgi:DNA-binding NarL/FixJ family response regulator
MQVQANFMVLSDTRLVEDALAYCLRDCVFTRPTTLIYDEPWGCALSFLEDLQGQLSIVLTSNDSPEYLEDLWSLEPAALIAIQCSLDKLLQVIAFSQQGQRLKLTPTPHYQSPLTQAERRVLRCCAQGRNSKQIAQILAIQEHSVRNHLSTIYNKLGLRDRSQAVLYYWGMMTMVQNLR